MSTAQTIVKIWKPWSWLGVELLVVIAIWFGVLGIYHRPTAWNASIDTIADQALDVYPSETIDNRIAVFTRESPALQLPRTVTGPTLARLVLRSPRTEARSIAVSLNEQEPIVFDVANQWRAYQVLLPAAQRSNESQPLTITTNVTVFERDDRRIGIALAEAHFLAVGMRADVWMLALAFGMAWQLFRRLGIPGIIAVVLAGGAFMLAEPLLNSNTYDMAFVAGSIALLHGLFFLVQQRNAWIQRIEQRLRQHAGIVGITAATIIAAIMAWGTPLLEALRIISVTLAALGVFVYAGFGVVGLLRTWRLKPALPLLTPAIGLAMVIAAGHALAYLPIGTHITAWPLMAGFTLLNLWAWRRGCRPTLGRIGRDGLAPMSIALVLGIAPLLAVGYLTTIGGTIDAIGYVARAENMQVRGLMIQPVASATNPIETWVSYAIVDGFRQGDAFALAFISSLFGLRPHLLFSVMMAIWYLLTTIGVYALARYTLRLGKTSAIVGGLLAAIQPLSHWAILDNFFSQASATGIFCFVLIAMLAALRSRTWQPALLAGLLFATLAALYNVYLVHIAGALAITALALAWRHARRATYGRGGFSQRQASARIMGAVLVQLAVRGIIVVGIALAVMPVAWMQALHYLAVLGDAVTRDSIAEGAIGNILVFPHPAEVIGVVNHVGAAFNVDLPQIPDVPATMFLTMALAVIGVGITTLRFWSRVVILALILMFGATIWHQRFWVAMGAGFPYGYFKLVALAAPLLALLTGHGLLAAYRAARRYSSVQPQLRLVILSLGVTLTALALFHTLTTTRYVAIHALPADSATLALSEAGYLVPSDEPLLVIDEQHPRRSWAIYLLRHRIVYDYEQYAAYQGPAAALSPRLVSYALIAFPDRQRFAVPNDPWFESSSHSILWRNERYALLERTDRVVADLPLFHNDTRILLSESPRITITGGFIELVSGAATFRQQLMGSAGKIEVLVMAETPTDVQLQAGMNQRTITLDRNINSIMIDAAATPMLALSAEHGQARLVAVRVYETEAGK